MKILVDTYDEEEPAMGWYYYLERYLDFPFQARSSKDNSLLKIAGMADTSDCLDGMFVLVDFNGEDELLFPLKDIIPIKVDKQAQEAIDDWKYWAEMGYHF